MGGQDAEIPASLGHIVTKSSGTCAAPVSTSHSASGLAETRTSRTPTLEKSQSRILALFWPEGPGAARFERPRVCCAGRRSVSLDGHGRRFRLVDVGSNLKK